MYLKEAQLPFFLC